MLSFVLDASAPCAAKQSEESMNQNHQAQGYLRFELFSSYEAKGKLVAAYSTRMGEGGISAAPYNQMNLGYNTADDKKMVLYNIKQTMKNLCLQHRFTVLTNQVHGDKIAVLKKENPESLLEISCTRDELLFLDGFDGVITDRRDVALMTFYADCTALMVYDPVRDVIGMAHSGWKGTQQRIGEKLVEEMRHHFGSDPADLLCVIGPTARSCCYEVDENVKTALEDNGHPFMDHALASKNDLHYMLDMETLNRAVMVRAGIPNNQIEGSGYCTICNPDKFYSFRRDGVESGRMSAIMGLPPFLAFEEGQHDNDDNKHQG